MDIKRIIKEYYEQLYAHKFDNLNEMNQFLERHNLPKLVQEEIDNLIRTISIKEIESIINNLPKQKAPHPNGLTGEFYKTFRKLYYPVVHNLFQKIEAEEYILTHSMRSTLS